jgi:hypothetical protein
MARRTIDAIPNSSFSKLTFVMEMGTEREQYAKVFPDPLPVGYVLKHRWETAPNGMAQVVIEPVCAVAVLTMENGAKVEVLKAGHVSTPASGGGAAPANSLDRTTLMTTKTIPQLRELAAERGVSIPDKVGKETIVGLILQGASA